MENNQDMKKRPADAKASQGVRKKHKKRKRIKLDIPSGVVMSLGITSALVVVVLLAFTMFFNVRTADITGSELYTYDQILLISGVNDNTNLLRMNTDVIEKRLVNGLPYVEEAKVTKKFPDTVKIEIKEADVCASLQTDDGYMLISRAGVVLETQSSAPVSGKPVIKGFEAQKNLEAGGAVESKDSLKAKIVTTLLDCMEKLEFDKVYDIDISDRTNIILRYDDRIDIYIGSSYDMEYKLESIKLVIDQGVTDSFRGMLRYNGPESGITELSEDAINRMKTRTAKKQTKPAEEQDGQTGQTTTAQQQEPDTQPDDGQGYVPEAEPVYEPEQQAEPEDGNGGDNETPAVTAAPPETELPPETTTWNGW